MDDDFEALVIYRVVLLEVYVMKYVSYDIMGEVW